MLQAKEDKFKGAVFRNAAGDVVGEHTPIIADRRPPGVALAFKKPLQDSVAKEPALEFTAIFSSIRVLPTAVANAVPSQSSGAALAPPAAFQVKCCAHKVEISALGFCHVAQILQILFFSGLLLCIDLL